MHENDFFNEDLLCALAGVAGEDNVLMSEPMREHTTFKIGGPADVFVTPDTEQGLVATLDTCLCSRLPITASYPGHLPWYSTPVIISFATMIAGDTEYPNSVSKWIQCGYIATTVAFTFFF